MHFSFCFEMIRLIILYYRLQGMNQEVTAASATENAGSTYSRTARSCDSPFEHQTLYMFIDLHSQ